MLLNIPKEIVSYSFIVNKIFVLVFISLYRGWSVLKLNAQGFVLKLNNIYFYKCNNFNICNNIILGLYKNYNKFLKLRGMGFKYLLVRYSLLLKINFSNRLVYNIENNMKIYYKTKQQINVVSRCLFKIQNLMFFFNDLNRKHIYKKKGVFIKGYIYFLKFSSKKLKF